MSIHSRVTKWRNVGRFCAERAADYSELLALELEETKKRLIREVGALVAMAVAALFALAFVCLVAFVISCRTRPEASAFASCAACRGSKRS
jgi:uncharacterized membrane protein YqjE